MKPLIYFFLIVCPIFVIAQEAEPETQWTKGVHASINLTQGNSNTSLFELGGTSKVVHKKHTVDTSATYAYGESEQDNGEDKTTRDTSGAKLKYSYLFNSPLYGFVAAEALQDQVANIDYRVTLGPGLGFYLIKNEKMTLSLESGLAYQTEKVGDKEEDGLAIRIAQNYEHQLNENAKVWQNLEYIPTAEDTDDYLLNAELGVESILSGNVSLRFVIKNRYDSIPAAGSEQNDLTLTAGLSLAL